MGIEGMGDLHFKMGTPDRIHRQADSRTDSLKQTLTENLRSKKIYTLLNKCKVVELLRPGQNRVVSISSICAISVLTYLHLKRMRIQNAKYLDLMQFTLARDFRDLK